MRASGSMSLWERLESVRRAEARDEQRVREFMDDGPFVATGNEPRKRMREGYRIFDDTERMWLECRQWFAGLGWIDFWTHDGKNAQRFPGAKSARRMAADLAGERFGALTIINKRGEVV